LHLRAQFDDLSVVSGEVTGSDPASDPFPTVSVAVMEAELPLLGG